MNGGGRKVLPKETSPAGVPPRYSPVFRCPGPQHQNSCSCVPVRALNAIE